MEMFIKQHIKEMRRYQTSLGRDLDNGIRLDRNEKVSEFTKEQMNEIFGIFNKYSLSASPEALPLYKKIAETLESHLPSCYLFYLGSSHLN